MYANFGNDGLTKKDIYCKYGCGTLIQFFYFTTSDTRVCGKATGKLIPLNLDNSPHNCPNRPHKNKVEYKIRTCNYCNQQITFEDSIRAKSGKRIPLNLKDKSYHNCSQNPFNRSRLKKKLQEEEVVSRIQE
jgi:hypothetical protein